MAEDQKEKTLHIRYRNNPAYRSVHAGGAYGGVLPSTEIFLGIFSERTHFPESATVEINEETKQGVEKVQIEKGIVREMEIGLIMNVHVAKAIRQWLDEKIAFVEQVTADPKNAQIEIIGGRSEG
ncbi:MAG: hypothetical protein ABSG41_15470 [Bryobacteraceae bacterium]|jgi:hypothetical protein